MIFFLQGLVKLSPEIERQIIEIIRKISEKSSPSQAPAAEILLSLVPLLGVVFGTILLFFYFYWSYKQKKELIQQGKYKPRTYENLRKISFLLGCLSTSIGLPMSLLFLYLEGISYIMLGGLIPFTAGIGFLLFYIFSYEKK